MAQKSSGAVANVERRLAVRFAAQDTICDGASEERKGASHTARRVHVDQTVGVGMHREEPPRGVEPSLDLSAVGDGEVQRGLRSRQIDRSKVSVEV